MGRDTKWPGESLLVQFPKGFIRIPMGPSESLLAQFPKDLICDVSLEAIPLQVASLDLAVLRQSVLGSLGKTSSHCDF